MRNPLIVTALVCALATPSVARAETPDPFAGRSKQELFDAGRRYRSKLLDCRDAFDVADVRIGGLKRKLVARTSTAIQALVVPPVVESTGVSTELVVIIGFAAAAVGVVLGVLLKGSGSPTVVVAK